MTATDNLRRDRFGYIDWASNGWPEPNPYGAGDTSTMPDDVWDEWVASCEVAEEWWERECDNDSDR